MREKYIGKIERRTKQGCQEMVSDVYKTFTKAKVGIASPDFIKGNWRPQGDSNPRYRRESRKRPKNVTLDLKPGFPFLVNYQRVSSLCDLRLLR